MTKVGISHYIQYSQCCEYNILYAVSESSSLGYSENCLIFKLRTPYANQYDNSNSEYVLWNAQG